MIEVVTTFNDGATRYYAGERVDEQNFQPDSLKSFLEYGWVRVQGSGATPVQSGVEYTLDIQDGHADHVTEV